MFNTDYFIKWKELDEIVEERASKDILTIYLPTDSLNNVFISNNIEKERSFSIEFERHVFEDYSLKMINGLKIEICENTNLNPDKLYMVVKNASIENDYAFIGFSVAVFDAIEGTRKNEDALYAFDKLIDEYHNFFGFEKKLSKEREQGLLAELIYLEKIIKEQGDSVVCNWNGSESNKRDFIFDGYSVEIKSTRNQEQDIIHVSNENQLDNNLHPILYLTLFVFDENTTGVSLPDYILEVYELIKKVEYKKIFIAKIAMHGINPLEYESKYKFALEKVKTYQIDDNFPKLVRNNIPNVIFDVKYKLNLSDITYREGFLV